MKISNKEISARLEDLEVQVASLTMRVAELERSEGISGDIRVRIDVLEEHHKHLTQKFSNLMNDMSKYRGDILSYFGRLVGRFSGGSRIN